MYKEPDIYGLVGYPLGHSYSQHFFSEKFEREGINARYENFEIPQISDIVEIITIPGLKGFNVTIPYKQAIIPYLDRISPLARKANAVNVVKVLDMPDGTRVLEGHNTDCGGFLYDIKPLLTPQHRKALILGTGGAAHAICTALEEIGISSIRVSRNSNTDSVRYSDLSEQTMQEHKLIVQCTPLGMYPDIHSYPPVPYGAIGHGHICYDLVYNPDPTQFMARCAAQGATVRGGIGMLHQQAILAWEIWNDNSHNISSK